ncbi:MAG TPA: alkaline phosphatase family protein [Pyrinomonadaceae bacterium]|nr:alkaline phosphatase family protein [Pyrinomonadaceae bacterium]
MTAQNSNLDKIEHIVVLMMENRSFDNVLGWLYDPDNPPPFNKKPNGTYNGVNSAMSNPGTDGKPVYVAKGTDTTAPYPDPNEPYQFVYRQMYNEPPTLPIPNTTATPAMQGFVIDYTCAIATADAEAKAKGKPPFDVEPGIIMNCFAPSALPVINGLAQNYAVCDNWLSSVPTQTFPNRSFIHAATSSGNVYNTWKTGDFPLDVGVFINNTKTIYNLLEENGVSWKIYHGGPLLLCNALIIQEQLWDFAFTGNRFFPFEQFLSDLKTPGALPAYTFIEPNMMCSSKYGPENDMHPAYAIFDYGPPTDALYGDKLIYDIYTALRQSDYWEKTLLIITFDEHGGCFDHFPTPPPPTVSPDGVVIPYTNGLNGGSGFDFSRFGVRVPAVLVSPWIEEGTICHTQFDHTSVIKTVSEKWLGGQNLTKRDVVAHCVSEVLSLSIPRADNPDITPVPPPAFTGCGNQSLSPLQRDLLAAAAVFAAQKTKRLLDLNALDTKDKAVTALDNISEELT